MFKQLYEQLTRGDLLDFQSFLIQHLPSYVDVELESADTIKLDGDFNDPVEIQLLDIGTDSARIKIRADYEWEISDRCDIDWRPSKLNTGDLRSILMTLNTCVGRGRAIRWLESQGFHMQAPAPTRRAPYDRAMNTKFEFIKDFDDQSGKFRLLVSFDSSLNHAYTQVGHINTPKEQGNFWQNNRHSFELRTLKRLQHAVEQAIDEFHSSGSKHHELNTPEDQISHLELKKHG